MATSCFSCQQEQALDTIAEAERIWVGEHWRVAHAVGSALPGWLVVVPRRHTTTVAEHTAAEAAELGSLLVATSSAVQTVTDCPKTYIAQFAEAEGFGHTHFHVIPRPASLPADRTGPGVFWYLRRPESEHVSVEDRHALAERLTPAIAMNLARAES